MPAASRLSSGTGNRSASVIAATNRTRPTPVSAAGGEPAREAKAPANERGAQRAVVYSSEQVHMSIPKAMALLGLGRESLRLLPVDAGFRLDPAALVRAMKEDEDAGRNAMAIVASAGTVNTGAIDPLAEIADIAAEHHLWLHVDGAYGALAAMAAPEKFRGLARADSISLDPHKWLYQPLDCGCVLYRDAAAARKAFSWSGDYAKALEQDPDESFALPVNIDESPGRAGSSTVADRQYAARVGGSAPGSPLP